ncbi:MAG: glycoside hydrolase family 19 protein [Bacteroidota bacterium]
MRYIRKFQHNHGLVPDGIIGKFTLSKMRDVFGFQNPYQIGHFLGQVAEESGNFRFGEENLNYSATRLLQIFPKYFNAEQAKKYARKPEQIANRVYANRIGNGDFASGDGWKYRGRGAIQLTGRANYKSFAEDKNDHRIMDQPDIIITDYYWEVALWYFDIRGIWALTNAMNIPTIRKVTKLINGGFNGIDHRIKLTKHFYQLARRIY